MESTLISKGDSGSVPHTGGIGTERFYHIVLSNLKYLMRFPRMDTHPHYRDPEDARCDPRTHVAKHAGGLRNKTLMAVAVLFLLTLMILVFLWNYKCIVIDKVCKGNSELLTPVFKND